MKLVGIYKITNIANGKIYVGKSTHIKDRLSAHKRMLKNNEHTCSYLQEDYLIYGSDSFMFDIMELCTIEELSKRESYWSIILDVFNKNKGYNIAPINENGSYTHSQETVDKIQKSRKWYKPSEETKRKISLAKIGKKGRCMSDEHKKIISLTHKGKILSIETKEKMFKNRVWINLSHSEETKKKMSNNSKNKRQIKQLTLSGEFIQNWDSIADALKFHKGAISACCRGIRNNAANYKWEYI